jgi:hypothetical protein
MTKTFTAREVLGFLYAEAKEWKEDVDGDCVDGAQKVYVTHHVVIGNGLLDELLDMAGVKRARYDESALEALKRISEDDTPAEAFVFDQTVPRMHE